MTNEKRKALSFPQKMRAVLKVNGICPYCDAPLSVAFENGKTTHFDHMLPIQKGGTNDDANLVACCADCNLSKRTKTVFEFMCERMGLQIPVWAHYDPEGSKEDWFDSDTFLAGVAEHDDEQSEDEAVVADADDEIDIGIEIQDAQSMIEEGYAAAEPPLCAGTSHAADDNEAWIPLGVALMSAFNRMPGNGAISA